MTETESGSCDSLALAREKALRLLDIRNRSSQELKRHLVSTGFLEKVVDLVLGELSELGLVDDHRFAMERARAMGKSKGWGPLKIMSDLKGRGIVEQVAETAISQAYQPYSLEDVMRRLVRKHFGDKVLNTQSDRKLRGKIQRYLIGKGFEPEEVWAVLHPG